MSRAFLATLRDEPSSVDLSAAFNRKERAGAIFTVSGLAFAITRAEEHMRERVRTSRAADVDIFDTLTATDYCAGPALYKPYTPTPLPPPPSPDQTVVMPRIPLYPLYPLYPPTPMSEAVVPAHILVLDRHAFYHPPGPLPDYAAGPTQRSALGWAVLACAPLIALVALAIVLFAARPWQPNVVATLPAAPAKLEATAPLVVDPPPQTVAPEEPPILVVDVKALKPPKSRTHR